MSTPKKIGVKKGYWGFDFTPKKKPVTTLKKPKFTTPKKPKDTSRGGFDFTPPPPPVKKIPPPPPPPPPIKTGLKGKPIRKPKTLEQKRKLFLNVFRRQGGPLRKIVGPKKQ